MDPGRNTAEIEERTNERLRGFTLQRGPSTGVQGPGAYFDPEESLEL